MCDLQIHESLCHVWWVKTPTLLNWQRKLFPINLECNTLHRRRATPICKLWQVVPACIVQFHTALRFGRWLYAALEKITRQLKQLHMPQSSSSELSSLVNTCTCSAKGVIAIGSLHILNTKGLQMRSLCNLHAMLHLKLKCIMLKSFTGTICRL